MNTQFLVIRAINEEGKYTWNNKTFEQLSEMTSFDRDREEGLIYILQNYHGRGDFQKTSQQLRDLNYSPVDIIILFRALLELSLGEINKLYQEEVL
ncbi:MAG: hypothetical protein AAFO03_16990 [Bacteroidota bacterium]